MKRFPAALALAGGAWLALDYARTGDHSSIALAGAVVVIVLGLESLVRRTGR